MKFKIGQKVLIRSKSEGRALSDIRKSEITEWHVMNNICYRVGWIIERRPTYWLIGYRKNGRGIDFYTDEDLKTIEEDILEESLFEI